MVARPEEDADKSKKCTGCGQIRMLTAFYFGQGRNRNQYDSKCIPCKRIDREVRYRIAHPDVKRRKDFTLSKKCPACGIIKEPEEYPVSRGKGSGRDCYCRECKRINNKTYNTLELQRIYKATQKKKNEASDPVYFKMNQLHVRAKCRARRRSLPFDITVADLMEITRTHCPVFGIEFDFIARFRFNGSAPSLDRFYPHLGYVKGNVKVISLKANRMKLNGTPEELMRLGNWANEIHKATQQSGTS